MSHSFDFPAVSEKLFILRHLAAGSRAYCSEEGDILRGSQPYGDDAWRDYAFRLRKLISAHLIECSAKVRIFEDTIGAKVKPSEFKAIDGYAQKDCPIGQVVTGSFRLTIRESCNKVIHATSIEPVWANARATKPARRFTYWTGGYLLQGKHGKTQWSVQIDIPNWCAALDLYLEQLWELVDWDDLPYE